MWPGLHQETNAIQELFSSAEDLHVPEEIYTCFDLPNVGGAYMGANPPLYLHLVFVVRTMNDAWVRSLWQNYKYLCAQPQFVT